MPFDLNTAKPVESGFDLGTAKPESEQRDTMDFESLDRVLPEYVFGADSIGNIKDGFDVAAGTLMTFDQQAQKDIWEKQLNEAGIEHKWTEDPEGYPVLSYHDSDGQMKSGYINKPGLSTSDVTGGIAQALGFLGTGGLLRILGGAQKAGVGANVAKAATGSRKARALTSGGIAAGESVALDKGANAFGAEISGEEMARNAGGAAIAGSILQPAGEVAASGTQRAVNFGKNLVSKRGSSAPAIQRTKNLVLENAGEIAPLLRDAPSEFWSAVQQQTKNAQTTDDVVQAATEQAYREEIPGFQPLRAYTTGKNSDFAEMDAVGRGRYGGAAQDELRTVQRQNQEAVERRVDRLGEEVGGRGFDSVTEAGTAVQRNLRDEYDASKDAVNQAYTEAAELRGQFLGEGVSELPGRMEGALVQGSHKLPNRPLMRENYPATFEILEAAKQIEGGDLPLQEFEQVRRYINGLARGAQSSDRAAALAAARELDRWGDDMLDRALFAGDEGAVEALKGARAANRKHVERFGENKTRKDGRNIPDRAGKVINDIVNTDISPVGVVNYLVGSGKIGQKKESLAVLDRLQKAVGRDSEAWSALQEAGLLRMFYDDAGRIRNTGQITKRWDQMNQGDGKAWATRLYGKEDMDKINGLMTLIKRTQRDSRDYVPSGPAIDRLNDMLNKGMRSGIATKFPIVGGLLADMADGVRRSGAERRQTQEALEAVYPPNLKYMPNVSLSDAIGEGLAGAGATGARSESQD